MKVNIKFGSVSVYIPFIHLNATSAMFVSVHESNLGDIVSEVSSLNTYTGLNPTNNTSGRETIMTWQLTS